MYLESSRRHRSAIVYIILGMGMPSQAAYLIMAIFAAPAIVKMGIPILAAHLFVFYYAVYSGITPLWLWYQFVLQGLPIQSGGKSLFRQCDWV